MQQQQQQQLSASSAGGQPLLQIPSDRRIIYEEHFARLEIANCGYVTGEQCCEFFGKSGLSNSDLGLIWTLSVVPGAPNLMRDEFVLALHLIFSKLAGTDIPQTLPPELVPSTHTATQHALVYRTTQQNAALPSSTESPLLRTPQTLKQQQQPQQPPPSSVKNTSIPSLTSSASAALPFMSPVSPEITAAAIKIKNMAPSMLQQPNQQGVAPQHQYLFPTIQLQQQTSHDPQTNIPELSARVEELTLERQKITSSVTALSLQTQELTLKHGQIRARHDSEFKLVLSLRESREKAKAELAAIEAEIIALELSSKDIQEERIRLHREQNEHAAEALRLRAKIVSLNSEVAEAREALGFAVEGELRERENRDFFQKTAMNVAAARDAYQMGFPKLGNAGPAADSMAGAGAGAVEVSKLPVVYPSLTLTRTESNTNTKLVGVKDSTNGGIGIDNKTHLPSMISGEQKMYQSYAQDTLARLNVTPPSPTAIATAKFPEIFPEGLIPGHQKTSPAGMLASTTVPSSTSINKDAAWAFPALFTSPIAHVHNAAPSPAGSGTFSSVAARTSSSSSSSFPKLSGVRSAGVGMGGGVPGHPGDHKSEWTTHADPKIDMKNTTTAPTDALEFWSAPMGIKTPGPSPGAKESQKNPDPSREDLRVGPRT